MVRYQNLYLACGFTGLLLSECSSQQCSLTSLVLLPYIYQSHPHLLSRFLKSDSRRLYLRVCCLSTTSEQLVVELFVTDSDMETPPTRSIINRQLILEILRRHTLYRQPVVHLGDVCILRIILEFNHFTVILLRHPQIQVAMQLRITNRDMSTMSR